MGSRPTHPSREGGPGQVVHSLQKARPMWGGVYQCISRNVQIAGMLLRNCARRPGASIMVRVWIMFVCVAKLCALMISISVYDEILTGTRKVPKPGTMGHKMQGEECAILVCNCSTYSCSSKWMCCLYFASLVRLASMGQRATEVNRRLLAATACWRMPQAGQALLAKRRTVSTEGQVHRER